MTASSSPCPSASSTGLMNHHSTAAGRYSSPSAIRQRWRTMPTSVLGEFEVYRAEAIVSTAVVPPRATHQPVTIASMLIGGRLRVSRLRSSMQRCTIDSL